jgi:hypothetical protein
MRLKLLIAAAAATVVAIVAGLTIAPTASAAGTTNIDAVPVQGTIDSTGGMFDGNLDVNRVALQNGQLRAIGTLSGDVVNAAGDTVGTVTDKPVSVPVTAEDGSCQILDLSIGAVNLNVLGLIVQLDPVHLNITAQQGSGNLLGNLLCTVAHLLDNNGPSGSLGGLGGLLAPIVNLVNQIIGRL